MNKHLTMAREYEPRTANQLEAHLLSTLSRTVDEWTVEDTQRYTATMLDIIRLRERELQYTIERIERKIEQNKRDLMIMQAARKGSRVLKLEP